MEISTRSHPQNTQRKSDWLILLNNDRKWMSLMTKFSQSDFPCLFCGWNLVEISIGNYTSASFWQRVVPTALFNTWEKRDNRPDILLFIYVITVMNYFLGIRPQYSYSDVILVGFLGGYGHWKSGLCVCLFHIWNSVNCSNRLINDKSKDHMIQFSESRRAD